MFQLDDVTIDSVERFADVFEEENFVARVGLPRGAGKRGPKREITADQLPDDVGIRFNDKERSDVSEYCISEGWVKVPSGKTVDRKGQPLLIKLKGKVEAFYR